MTLFYWIPFYNLSICSELKFISADYLANFIDEALKGFYLIWIYFYYGESAYQI